MSGILENQKSQVWMIQVWPSFFLQMDYKDVAVALGYSNTRDALAKHVDDEDKDTVAIHDGMPGNPNQVIINESGFPQSPKWSGS